MKQRRERAGLTRLEVATLTGVTEMTIYRWETEATKPHRRLLRAWTDALKACELRKIAT